LILLQRLLVVALGFQGPRIKQVAVRRAEIRVQPNELIQRGARCDGVAFCKLRLRDSQHEIGVVFVKARERLTILGDGFVVPAVA